MPLYFNIYSVALKRQPDQHSVQYMEKKLKTSDYLLACLYGGFVDVFCFVVFFTPLQ